MSLTREVWRTSWLSVRAPAGTSATNTDFSTQIDHAYDTPNNGNFTTSTATDPTNGPTIASVSGPADSLVAWDTTLVALKNALTVNGVRQDMLIGYDFNETGGSS